MAEISYDRSKNLLHILNYDGEKDHKEIFPINGYPTPQMWNFSRERSNHAYTGSEEVSYDGKSRNNILISPHKKHRLNDIINAFIHVENGKMIIEPIGDIQEVARKGHRLLKDLPIIYTIPENVRHNEEIPPVSEERIIEILKQYYCISTRKVISLSTKNKVYFILGENSGKYIFKDRGRDREKSEKISQTLLELPNIFPTIFCREDDTRLFTIPFHGRNFGLEEYVEGKPLERNLSYFYLLGNQIAQIHKKLKLFSENYESLEHGFSESNLVSIYLDIMSNRTIQLKSHLEDLISSELNSRLKLLTKTTIHGDLNSSNIHWKDCLPIIIDTETLSTTTRIMEFISPIFFEGNLKRPSYILGSLDSIISGFNSDIEFQLSEEEQKTIPLLLKATLLKIYARKIRRFGKDKIHLKETEELLNQEEFA